MPEETRSHRQSLRAPSVVELHAEKNPDRQQQASQKVAADAEVDEALVYHFNEKFCLKTAAGLSTFCLE